MAGGRSESWQQRQHARRRVDGVGAAAAQWVLRGGSFPGRACWHGVHYVFGGAWECGVVVVVWFFVAGSLLVWRAICTAVNMCGCVAV